MSEKHLGENVLYIMGTTWLTPGDPAMLIGTGLEYN